MTRKSAARVKVLKSDGPAQVSQKLIHVNKEIKDAQKIVDDLGGSLEGMRNDQREKVSSTLEGLANMLDVTADKYMTVRGLVACVQSRNELMPPGYGDALNEDDYHLVPYIGLPELCSIARAVSAAVRTLGGKFGKVKTEDAIERPELLGELIDQFYDSQFCDTFGSSTGPDDHNFYGDCSSIEDEKFETWVYAIMEMERVNVCSQIGQPVDELAEFIASTNEQIGKSEAERAEQIKRIEELHAEKKQLEIEEIELRDKEKADADK